MEFEFHELELEGAFLIHAFSMKDIRGGFAKYFEKDIYEKAGIAFQVNETFLSCSDRNVIRGLHFQTNKPQAKLVFVVAGKAWDVIVDIRPESKTFGRWSAQELSAENHMGFFVPRGFAHGFASMEDNTIMMYLCDGGYDKESDTGILYNDPAIGIEWPIEENLAIHSERDLKLLSLEGYLKSPIKL